MLSPDPERLLSSEVAARDATDYRFSWGTYIGWTILTLGLYSHYGTYRLLQRRVDHAKRRITFSAALWHVLARRAEAEGRTAGVQAGLDQLSRIHATLEEYEAKNRRSPALLVLLRAGAGIGLSVVNFLDAFAPADAAEGPPAVAAVLVGLFALAQASVGAFINHTLNKDLRFIEAWEDSLNENAAWVLGHLGSPVASVPRTQPIPRRETAVYVVLSVVTLGLFSIWWRYALMREGNDHFTHDADAEDRLLRALGVAAHGAGPP
ncbi:MAG: DUF4234 domain-containing protein, partial [Actinomycetota bacterium]